MGSVLVPLADGCEELEAVTIIDILRRGGIEVVTVGLKPGPVTASRGVVLLPDTTLDQIDSNTLDMVVLPGGLGGADRLDNDPRIAQILREIVSRGKYAAAICAAPRVLANLGLLKGKRVTGYPGVMKASHLEGTDYTGEAVELDGKLVTSRGPGTALDFALTLVELLTSREKRIEVEAALKRP
ncbi:MAG: DJ-1/PfpI family protein [Magnetococcales bacterium]|nr:DJ-1/PfpI family protein [Magnetococcales bacterium]